MNFTRDQVIILGRTDYGERDRILTVLGRNFGKATIIAKGTRSAKSKLAGSIELLSEADIQYVAGKGKMHTLTGARLHKNYSQITSDIDRTMLAYDLLKILNKIIEEGHGSEYYGLLSASLSSLNEVAVSQDLVKAWFYAQILDISGHLPNFSKDPGGNKLEETGGYNYDFDAHCFAPSGNGKYSVKDIKLLRLLATSKTVPRVNDETSASVVAQLVEQLVRMQVY